MYEDIPRHKPFKTFLIVLIIVAILGGFGYYIYKAFFTKETEESPATKASSLLSPALSPSSLTTSPSPSLLPSPSPSGTPDYKIPTGETFSIASTADTNGDKKDETLVITKISTGKYHAYILDSTGQSLFDNKELLDRPIRIATQTYDPSKESYLSWMMVFSENSGQVAFIHWTGTAYEIPQSQGL